MLRGCTGLSAVLACLAVASPADARARSGPDREHAPTAPAFSVALSGIDRSVARRETNLLPRGDREIRPSGDPLLGLDGMPIPQRGMLGRLSLDEGVDLGLGLFSVNGANLKERELKRSDPIRDVAPRSSRVAGAGLRLNF